MSLKYYPILHSMDIYWRVHLMIHDFIAISVYTNNNSQQPYTYTLNEKERWEQHSGELIFIAVITTDVHRYIMGWIKRFRWFLGGLSWWLTNFIPICSRTHLLDFYWNCLLQIWVMQQGPLINVNNSYLPYTRVKPAVIINVTSYIILL